VEHYAIIETILRDRGDFFREIRDGIGLGRKIRAMLVLCLAFLAVYGAVMGAAHGVPQAVSSLVKLPLLFLATLVICTPSLHFFHLLFGARQTVGQTLALVLTAVTTTAVLLLSFAPITLFFLLSSAEYAFFKLLNVGFLVIAGVMGVLFLRLGLSIVTASGEATGAGARRVIFIIWVLLYAFVGMQMAWTLRPYIGEPGREFILFAQVGGNIYSDLLSSVIELFY
jgi:hypothetical protein